MTMLSATTVIAVCAVLISCAVVSSPVANMQSALSDGGLLKFGARNEASGFSLASVSDTPVGIPPAEVTTVVTHHHHSRIVESLGAEDITRLSRSQGMLSHNLIKPRSNQTPYTKKTYTHTLASRDKTPRHIELATTTPMFGFTDVGFPHIETSKRRDVHRYKPYKRLIKLKTRADGSRYGVPIVRCHGYSPERTEARASRYATKIRRYAERYKVDMHLVKAVIAQESCYRNHAVSPAGAVGLMQLMPATAKWLGVKDKKSASQNLKAGIRYLGQLTRRFESSELALAAYNAGPANVKRYKGIPPFKETQHYVKKVMHNYHSYIATSRYNDEDPAELL